MIDSIPLQLESRFIAVEGPVGSGKTSLARRIAEHVDGKLILEEPEKNPFLENFYKDPRSNALPTELSFLFQRSKLLESINQEELFSSQSITDFLFDKDIIFTELNLTQEEIEQYVNSILELAYVELKGRSKSKEALDAKEMVKNEKLLH